MPVPPMSLVRTYKCIICGAKRDEDGVVWSKVWGKWVCSAKYINDCNIK
jgi:hypothetical protein